MVSEFVLTETQTTPQDHFLQASETYKKSSIVNFNQKFISGWFQIPRALELHWLIFA